MYFQKLWPAALVLVMLASGCGQSPGGSAGAGKPSGPAGNQTQTNQTQSGGSKGNPSQANSTQTTKSGANLSSNSQQSQPVWPVISVKPAAKLPLGLLGNALAVNSNGAVFSVGGYTGVQSLQNVYRVTGGVASSALLPVPTHDAAAGFIGSNLYVFGGGQSASYNTILQIHNNHVAVVGHLARPLSDAAAVPFTVQGKQGLVLVGGYDGQIFNQQVQFVTLSQGKLVFTKLFTLPQGVRYPAVTVQDNTLYIAGGKYVSGQLSQTVYAWSEQDPSVHLVGKFSTAIEKAALFATPGFIVLAGGLNTARNPQTSIVAMNVKTGATRILGHLPVPVAYLGYGQAGQTGYLVGGMKSASETNLSSEIYTVSLSQ